MTKLIGRDHPAIETGPRDADSEEGSVFVLLARRARGRNPYALLTTAVGGLADAAIIWSRYPGLHWLAAGFAAVAAYGIWGLADFGITTRPSAEEPFDAWRNFLAIVRGAALPAGVIAAIAAVGGFMAAALGGWQH